MRAPPMAETRAKIVLVDDDPSTLRAIGKQIRFLGHDVHAFDDPNEALSWLETHSAACLVLDLHMPGMTGLEVQARLTGLRHPPIVVFLSGMADIPSTVEAMRAGAVDFLEKPVERSDLAAAVAYAVERFAVERDAAQRRFETETRLNMLTSRQRDVLGHLLNGASNKLIARDLRISERTVKAHRHMLMEKLGAESLADLFAIAVKAGIDINTGGDPE